MKITRIGANYFLNKIINLLSRIYASSVRIWIERCVSPKPSNMDIKIVIDNLHKLFNNIKNNTEDNYINFKNTFDRPAFINKSIDSINYLFSLMFDKTYKIGKMEKITPEEIFLSVMGFVSRELYSNSYLFAFNGLAPYKLLERKAKIKAIIEQYTKIGIEDSIMNIFIVGLSSERLSDMKKIKIGNKTIRIPEYKLIKLIAESDMREDTDDDKEEEEEESIIPEPIPIKPVENIEIKDDVLTEESINTINRRNISSPFNRRKF